MGKNGRLGKDYGVVVGKDTKSRPGWKGPGYAKKVEPPKAKRATKDENTPEAGIEAVIPAGLQQLLLNTYRNTFPEILMSDSLQALLQQVKTALYERDFSRAFGNEEYLEAYSVRWSPSRSLCYQSILVDLLDNITSIFQPRNSTQSELEKSPVVGDKSTLLVTCFGGGAAEVVAFGGFLRCLQDALAEQSDVGDKLSPWEGFDKLYLHENGPQQSSPEHSMSIPGRLSRIDLRLVDSAQWHSVVHKLHDSLTNPPPLSKYASSSAREANEPLTADTDFIVAFRQDDVLEMSGSQLVDVVGGQPMLLTLLFTLNELYTSSVAKTTAFLLNMTTAVKSGSLLLVVDSPGSYSETTVGSEAKKYPMHWLLDHTLLETQKSRGSESAPCWVKLVSEESKWFRIPESVRYPIPLENMRYQMHLYRRM